MELQGRAEGGEGGLGGETPEKHQEWSLAAGEWLVLVLRGSHRFAETRGEACGCLGAVVPWKGCGAAQVSCVCRCPQIENASEVLITPLEKFRKEQIGAAKVTQPLSPQSCQDLAHCRMGSGMGGGSVLLWDGHGDDPAPGKCLSIPSSHTTK